MADAGDDPVAAAVAEFGRSVAIKLGRGGGPEDQLRAPVEALFKRLGNYIGLDTVAYGEVNLKEIRARPDYAVDVGNLRVGYVELKAPDRGIPPEWKPDKHEREQWEKLCALPNVIYTNGTLWGRYKYGVLTAPVVRLNGSLINTRQPLHPSDHTFELIIQEFLCWAPDQPRTLPQLIKIVAGLCRLLRDEVAAILSSGSHHAAFEDLTLLAADWRDLLFPDLDDQAFSDAYAQTIAFAMLLARVNGIAFDDIPLHEIAKQLGKKHTLMGKAFAILIDSEATDELRIIETLRRVIGAVDWEKLDDGKTNVYVELYERFLAEYDPELRKKSGSYYTPEPVARFMVDFVNQVLDARMKRPWGFAADDVVVVDPAMGTGTFLLEILRSVADTVDEKQGKGARPARLRELFQKRLVGFECQVAPYAVAELRLHQALKARFETDIPRTEVRFLTDALEDPYTEQQRFHSTTKVIEKSKAEANRIKRELPIMVVIGNPPHLENAKGLALWIEERRRPGSELQSLPKRPSLDDFRQAGRGRYESDLHALHWYFWRWATWKVFDAHPDCPAGVVALITPSSYTTGKAFAGMREYLRRTCDEGWIIDVSPEGNRSNPDTRIFGGVQRGLCIGIFARYGSANENHPAVIHRTQVEGTQEEKFERLQQIKLDDLQWTDCEVGWRQQFLATTGVDWEKHPQLCEIMPWTSRGVTTGRAWVYAPDHETLDARWRRLMRANTEHRRVLFQEKRDRKLTTTIGPLPGFPEVAHSLADENGPLPTPPIQVGFRSFDRQFLIPDNRLMEVPRPPLWAVRSAFQVYVTEQSSHPIESGPGVTFTAAIPDLHHYNNRSGRVLPLYRDRDGNSANFAPGLTEYISGRIGLCMTAADLLAYIAGIVAHSGYTRRFQNELQRPGIRVPITADPNLWNAVVEIGKQVVWLQTYGERYVDQDAGRPHQLRGLTERFGPRVHSPISDLPEEMPDQIRYDPVSLTLRVGDGEIRPVSRAVYEYDVAGFAVLRKWLDYRRRNPRHRRRSSELDDINCARWTPLFTNELLNLLTILGACVSMEPQQASLLAEICQGPLITMTDLEDAGILPVPNAATKPPSLTDPDSPTIF